MRKMIAVTLFVTGALFSVGSSFNLTFAKGLAKRVAVKAREVKAKGQFRLLNIYNSLKESNPTFVDAMNHATSGLASWYGGIFHGRKTAMGTTYNMYAMTAAHRSLPLGTWVQVTNEQNGKSVTVQVTDRGPYVANRVMDLSYAAAQKLGYANAGTTHISMRVLGDSPNETASNTIDSTTTTASIIPAMFSRVTAATDTENLSVNATHSGATNPDDSNSFLTAVSDIVTAPIQAVANIFA